MKDKTPIQEILRLESDLTNMFDSDYRVGQALLEYIRANRIELLQKEEAYHSRIKTE